VELPPNSAIYEHPATGFKTYGPPDFGLTYHEDAAVYELTSVARDLRILMARFRERDPAEVAENWLANAELEIESRKTTANGVYLKATDPSGRARAVEASRHPDGSVKLMSYWRPAGRERSAAERSDDEAALAMLFATAQGGTVAGAPFQILPAAAAGRAPAAPVPAAPEPPAPAPAPAPATAPAKKPIPMRFLVSPDVEASAMVPDEPGWTVHAAGGAISAEHPERGEFGRNFSWSVAPTSAEGSLTAVWMNMRNEHGGAGYTSVEVVERTPDSSAHAGGDAGMFKVRAARRGVPWEGWIYVDTWPVRAGAYHFSCSWMLAPVDGDPRIWPALKEAWESFEANPEAARSNFEHVKEIGRILRGENREEKKEG
jgi:hypothetical protein